MTGTTMNAACEAGQKVFTNSKHRRKNEQQQLPMFSPSQLVRYDA
jgi:hypothetical protein